MHVQQCPQLIGMTINLPGHPVPVTQCYLAIYGTHVIKFVYSFASFPSDWIWCLCLDPHCLCAAILVAVVLRMSLLFLFWNRRPPSHGRSRVEHIHTHDWLTIWINSKVKNKTGDFIWWLALQNFKVLFGR